MKWWQPVNLIQNSMNNPPLKKCLFRPDKTDRFQFSPRSAFPVSSLQYPLSCNGFFWAQNNKKPQNTKGQKPIILKTKTLKARLKNPISSHSSTSLCKPRQACLDLLQKENYLTCSNHTIHAKGCHCASSTIHAKTVGERDASTGRMEGNSTCEDQQPPEKKKEILQENLLGIGDSLKSNVWSQNSQ